jgi:hypothetical protein
LIEDDEPLIESELSGVDAQEPVGHAMKRATPNARDNGFADDLPGTAEHFRGRAAREGKQENPSRVGPALDKSSHAGGERLGLARARPGDHEQRPGGVLGGRALLRVKAGEVFCSFRQMCFARHRGFPRDHDITSARHAVRLPEES